MKELERKIGRKWLHENYKNYMKIYGSSKAAIYTLACEKKGIWTYSSEKKWCTVCFLRIYIHTSKIKHAQAVNLAVNWIAMLVT